MILSTSPVIARSFPSTRESSREDAVNVQVQDASKSENGQPQAPSSVERVNQAPESQNIQKTRNFTERSDASGLSEGERHVLEQLKARDREVRAHEAAHLAAAGSHATSGASYSFQRGPDGQLYAIGGEVGISLSKVSGDPQATLDKAEQIRAAALAPAQPSSQDQAIAARASQLAAEARREIATAESGDNISIGAVQTEEDKEDNTVKKNQEQAYKEVSDVTSEKQSLLLDVQA